MIDNEKQLKEILHIFDKEGILSDLIIIGSWSLLFYQYIFNEFKPLIRTTDIDFYIPNAKKIKANSSIIFSLKESNYDMVNDSLTDKTKFISPDGFEIEFLTKLNRDNLTCVKVGNTQIYAESLPYVEIFSGNYIEAEFDDLKVKVASPSSYILQKLIINSQRKNKIEKDIQSIKYVLNFIKTSQKSTEEFKNLFDKLPKKWQVKIQKTADDNDIKL